MAVEFESIGAGDQGNTNTLSWSHTIGGTNRHTIVVVGCNSSVLVNSVTVGAVSCSELNAQSASGWRNELWETDSEPATGSNTVTVNMSGMQQCLANSVNLEGVDQTNPSGDVDWDNVGSPGTETTTNPIGIGGGMFVDVIMGDTVPTVKTGQIERWSASQGSGDGGTSTKIASNNTDAMGWTWSSGGASNSVVTINPATPRKVTISEIIKR